MVNARRTNNASSRFTLLLSHLQWEGWKARPFWGGTEVGFDIDTGEIVQGHYEILACVGRGGMGAVYKAQDRESGRFVAIKVLAAERVPDARSNIRFQQEAKALARLNHPCIAKVLGQGVSEGGEPYLVMEFLDGITLAEKIASQGQLPIEETVRIFIQVCDGLAHAHAQKILHRDLKPSNIMLTNAGEGKHAVKILDFGIARMQENPESPSLHLTKTGELLGSPFYMSPEQAKGGRVDERSDLYSLGATLYEALTGGPPHVGLTPMSTLLRRELDRPILMSEASMGRSFPQELEGIVARLLNRYPDDRYNSALDVKRDLVRLMRTGFVVPRPFHRIAEHPTSINQSNVHVSEMLAYGLAAVALLGIVFLPKSLHHPKEPVVVTVAVAEEHPMPNLSFKGSLSMNQGETLLQGGDAAGAVNSFRKAIDEYRAKFQEGTDKEAECYEFIAQAYRLKGDFPLELDAVEKALAIYAQRPKANCEKLAFLHERAGFLYSSDQLAKKRSLAKGAQHYTEAASFYELVGSKELDVINCSMAAGLTFKSMKQRDAAVLWLEKSLNLAKRYEAKVDMRLIMIQDPLAECYREQGRYAASLQLFSDSLNRYERVVPKDPRLLFKLLNDTGEMHVSLASLISEDKAHLHQAELLYRRSIKFGQANQAISPDNVIDILIRLTDVNNSLGKHESPSYYQEAIKLGNEALRLVKARGSTNLPARALVLERIGAAYEGLGDSRLAHDYYREARLRYIAAAKHFEKIHGGENPDTASFMFHWARMDENLGDYAEAEQLFSKLVPMMEKFLGRENRHFVNIVFNRGFLLRDRKKFLEARRCFEQVYEIESKLVGPDDPNTKAALALCDEMEQATRKVSSNSPSK